MDHLELHGESGTSELREQMHFRQKEISVAETCSTNNKEFVKAVILGRRRISQKIGKKCCTNRLKKLHDVKWEININVAETCSKNNIEFINPIIQ